MNKDPILRTALLSQDHGGQDNRLLGQRKLTVPEASKAMGIGQTKLRGLIGDGEIRVIRILGKILLLESDLEDYLRGHYGPLRKVEKKGNGMSPLPEFVKNSALLKKSA